ncbi:PSP1 C-terminal conserved region containing protein [Novymonas esmeraldas]|uniref:PSP1 C-terminal conserved region containing protein n=1 Tax=Novymonas esmeraldas TaxID=1808958 RepID=A0AAW0F4B5_9TRYP
MSSTAPSSAHGASYPLVHMGYEAASPHLSSVRRRSPVVDVVAAPASTAPHYYGAQQGPVSGGFRPLAMSYAAPYSGSTYHRVGATTPYAGTSHPSSFYSLELSTGMSAQVPLSDFYAAAAASTSHAEDFHGFPAQPCYAESPLAMTDYHDGACVSPILGYGSPGSAAGVSGYGFMDAAGGSVISSVSFGGSRVPQWYVPRNYCALPCSSGPASGSTYLFYTDGASAGVTPTSVSAGAMSTEEEALGVSDGRLLRYVAAPPPPPPQPRLSPQTSPGPVGYLALPPSAAAASTGAGVGAGGAHTAPAPSSRSSASPSSSAAAASSTSPASRPASTPQFLSYDGRAYGIPLHRLGQSSADAAAAIAQSPLVTGTGRRDSASSPVDAAAPSSMRAVACGAGAVRRPCVDPHTTATPTPCASPRIVSDGSSVGAAAATVYSPEETALLADVHARLLQQQRRSSQHVKGRASAAKTTLMALRRLSSSGGSSSSAVPAAVVAAPPPLRSTRGSPCRAECDGAEVAALSPIRRLDTADDADAAAAVDHSTGAAEAASLEAPTQDALDRVLTMPGVLWRHDPYSRRVLSHSHGGAADDGSVAAGDSCASLPPSVCTPSTNPGHSHHHDATGSITQPPPSATTTTSRTQGSSGCSSSGSADVLRPSARRLPIKKVCVRHYAGGDDDDSSVSHDRSGVVGALLSVQDSPHAMPPLPPPLADRVAHAAEVVVKAAVDVCSPPVSAPAARTRPAVPKPRSKQSCPPALVADMPSGCTAGVERGVASAAVSHLSSSAMSAGLDASSLTLTSPPGSAVPAEAPERSSASSVSVAAADCPDAPTASASETATARPVVARRRGAYSSSLELSRMRSAYQSALTWAWRLRNARLCSSVPSAEIAAAVDTSLLVPTLADLEASHLVRMWHSLDASGCFLDALERRRSVIGTGSNSSTRVARRVAPLSRRMLNRRRSLETDAADGVRYTVLDKADMKYVCVLQHRFRRSTAVAAENFPVGAMVVVDGDMGVDTGVVELIVPREEYEAMSEAARRAAHLAAHLDFPLASSIHRVAREEEMAMHNNTQRPLEEATLDFLQHITTQPHLFQSCRVEWMHFVDVEFQADGQKLYVHYTCDAPVRFLELATFLNHIFHCRIWMKIVKPEES